MKEKVGPLREQGRIKRVVYSCQYPASVHLVHDVKQRDDGWKSDGDYD